MNINPPPSKALEALEREFEQDEDLWMLCRDLLTYDVMHDLNYTLGEELESNPMAQDYAKRLRALDREDLTILALSMSLCPLHLVDYAICFEDEDPECAAIRVIHSGHDT